MNVRCCAFTAICEEDSFWVDQYLAEVERLNVPFAVHLDRCGDSTIKALTSHPFCVGSTRADVSGREFNETHKQGVMDVVQCSRSFDWALAWDIDETFAPNASEEMERATSLMVDCINVKWVNLWGDHSHIRVDGPFSGGHRCKLYNLHSGRWAFTNKVVNGPKLFRRGSEVRGREVRHHDLVCLHWGMMTRDLREQHKERWDRIYEKAVGKNPYGFWDYALNETDYPPEIIPNPYV